MKSIQLQGTERTHSSKADIRGLRKQGLIPCVLYGKDTNIQFFAPEKELRKVIYTQETYLVQLEINGKTYESVARESQFHPVTESLLHMDFFCTRPDKAIDIFLPLKVEGNPAGVLAGGTLNVKQRRLRVSGLPSVLPSHISVDISHLELGQSMKVGAIAIENITILTSPDVGIATIEIPRSLRQK